MALEKLEKDVPGEPALKREIHRIVKMVDQDASLDEDWEQFSKNFDQVHSDFLKRLGDQYPQLSSNDFKLSAYLRMNLSTKEIASLLNISVRGVEASRYRLRKRLGLGTNVNLTEFLMRF
jgi:DNA-binding CsgD family transcriptional regulator